MRTDGTFYFYSAEELTAMAREYAEKNGMIGVTPARSSVQVSEPLTPENIWKMMRFVDLIPDDTGDGE